MLYVYAEAGRWMQVGKNDSGPEGWCKKDDLVLWSRPLNDQLTGIELKAFLINRITADGKLDKREYDGDLKQRYEVFDGPDPGAKVIGNELLYDVLYIYKHSDDGKGGERWLVSGYHGLGPATPLLGWVNKTKVKVWATRLCLEPNFDDAARLERRDRGIRAKLYPLLQQDQTEEYLKSGKGEKGLVDGAGRDPAFHDDQLSSTRMDGKLFRYPVLGATMIGTDNCQFYTGVSARMNVAATGSLEGFNEEVYLQARKEYEALKERKDKVGVVFVIEGSAGMQGVPDIVKRAIQSIRGQHGGEKVMRFGAVYYRNEFAHLPADEDPETGYLEVLPLSDDVAKVLGWIGKRSAQNWGDHNDQRAAHLALQRGLALLQRYETNVIVHIAARPDNTEDPTFGGKTLVDLVELGRGLGLGYSAHYLGYVLPAVEHDTVNFVRAAAYEGQRQVMSELAVALNNQLKGLAQFGLDVTGKGRAIAPEEIEVTGSDGWKVSSLDGFYFVMKAHLLPTTASALDTRIANDVSECLAMSQRTLDGIGAVVEDESFVSDRTTDITFSVSELLGLSPEARSTYDHLARHKVHIYQDARTYYRVADLQQPIFRYVLFYRDLDFEREIAELQRLVTSLAGHNADDSVEKLAQLWQARAESTLGTNYDKQKTTLADIQEKLMGIHKISMVKPFRDASILADIQFKDLMDRKIDRKKLGDYQKAAEANLEKLKAIKSQGVSYTIPGKDSKFYWVPVEYLFN
ncbi:MAG: hypothetical protein R2815_11555 [Flavobacteriales bacterium]